MTYKGESFSKTELELKGLEDSQPIYIAGEENPKGVAK